MISAPEADRKGPTTFLPRMQRIFSSQAIPLIVAILAFLLSLPTIRLGFMWDDLIQRTMMASVSDSSHSVQNPWQPPGEPATPGRVILNLFRLAGPAVNGHLRDLGSVPWWMYQGIKVALFRPLSALTHWLDFKTWGDRAAPMHLENIILYAVACLLAARLFARMETPVWIAGLAAFIFAVDSRHVIAVAWLANRNSLLAVIFGLLAVTWHDRWRREQWKPGSVLGPVFLALTAASTELGVATGAYLLGHVIFLDRGSWRRRALVLLPYGAVGLVWYLFFHAMDYGAYGSGLYIDPSAEPLRFLDSLLRRGPIMLAGQVAAVDPLPYFLVSAPARIVYWLGSAIVLLSMGVWSWQLLKGDRVAGFWSVGMVLSVVLVSGINVTTGRPLVFAGIGAAPLIAKFIWKALDGNDPHFRRKYWALNARVICTWFLVVHVLVSPLHFALRTVGEAPALLNLDPPLNFSAVAIGPGEDLVVVNPPDTFPFLYFSSYRAFRHQTVPAHVRLLAPGTTPVTVKRLDATTVLVRPGGGYMVPPGSTIGDPQGRLPILHQAYFFQHFDETYRVKEFPLRMHEKVEVTGMTAEVSSLTADGRPSEAVVRFAAALESKRWNWVIWDWSRRQFVPFAPPGPGESVTIPGPPVGMPVGVELFSGK